MSVTLNSTTSKVRNAKQVRQILDSYALEGVEIKLSEEGEGGTLRMAFEDRDPEMWEWPLALPRDQWPSEQAPEDDEASWEAWDELFGEKGQDGFLALLRDLAPHIETPIMVLAAASEYPGYSLARVWSIQPGAKEVETLDV